MYKIKIFSFPQSQLMIDFTIETAVNEWLTKHPHLEYANVSVTNSFNSDYTGQIKCVLTYKLKTISE